MRKSFDSEQPSRLKFKLKKKIRNLAGQENYSCNSYGNKKKFFAGNKRVGNKRVSVSPTISYSIVSVYIIN